MIERERETYVIHNEAGESANQALSPEEQEKVLSALKSDDEEDGDEVQMLSADDIKLLDADPFKAPKTDPQLDAALLVVRMELAAGASASPKLASAGAPAEQ